MKKKQKIRKKKIKKRIKKIKKKSRKFDKGKKLKIRRIIKKNKLIQLKKARRL